MATWLTDVSGAGPDEAPAGPSFRGGTARPTVVSPATPNPDLSEEVLRLEVERDRQAWEEERRQMAIEEARRKNVDREAYAKALEIARERQVPVEHVLKDINAQRAAARQPDPMRPDVPATNRWSRDLEVIPAVDDDLEQLGTMERLGLSLGQSWDKSLDQLEVEDIGNSYFWGDPLTGAQERRLREIEINATKGEKFDEIIELWGNDLSKDYKGTPYEYPVGVVIDAAGWVGDFVQEAINITLEEGASEAVDMLSSYALTAGWVALTTTAGAAGGLVVGGPAGALAGGVGGFYAGVRTVPAAFNAASVATAVRTSAYQTMVEYRNMKDDAGNPIDVDTRRGAAVLVSLSAGALEAIPMQKYAKHLRIPGVEKLLKMSGRKGLRELLRDPTKRATMKAVGKQIALMGSIEASQEAVSEGFKILWEITILDQKITPEQALRRIAMAGRAGAQFGGVVGTATTGIEQTLAKGNRDKAKARGKTLADLGAAAKQSKTLSRSQKLFQEHLKVVVEEHGEVDVSLPVEQARELFDVGNVAVEELQAQFPVAMASLEEAVETGDDVHIPLDELGVIAARENFDNFIPDMRPHADEMTLNEAETFLEEAEARVTAADETTEGDEPAAPRPLRETVQEMIAEQLVAAGRSPEVAMMEAQLPAAFLTTQTDDPVQALEDFNLAIEHADLTEQGQGAAFDPETDEIELPEGVVAPLGLDMTLSLDPDVPTRARLPALQEAPLREDFDSDEEFARAEALHEENLTQREVAKEFMADVDAASRVFDTAAGPATLHQRRRAPVKLGGPPQEYQLTAADKARVKALRAKVPGLGRITRHLLPDELALLDEEWAAELVEMYEQMPVAAEMAAVARAGIAKRGWYRRSQFALDTVFGEDAPRFTLLLAAMSPQTSVESNTINALAVWNTWVAADRPSDRQAIIEIMGESVQGNKGVESVLTAWQNNAVQALGATDAQVQAVVLSGPKVNSFNLNLRGFFDEVTNDAWMANYSLVDQDLFGRAGENPGKAYGYMAMSARVRAAMKSIDWQPMEGQETIWSWAKALYEMAQSDPDRTALQILEAGDLTHEVINATPDFEILFASDGIYRTLLEGGGYTPQLDELKEHLDQRAPSTLTGSVYKADSPDGVHLRRAAKRLDELVEIRAAAKARYEIKIGISSSTKSLPGLAKLQREAGMGDASAHLLLQEIAADALEYLTDTIDSVELEQVPAYGLYAGAQEPSLGLTVSFKGEDRERVLAALARFAGNFNQQQIHVREAPDPGTEIGHVYPDGSYNTPIYTYELAAPLNRVRVQEVIDASGLVGMTVTDTGLTAYYLGDPENAEALADFKQKALAAAKSLGADGRGTQAGFERLWAYGSGYGATESFDGIKRNFRPPKGDRANATAQRIAARLAGRDVKPVDPVKGPISEDQKILQTRIARAYRDMKRDNLEDPFVRKAYEEMAKEIIRQYGLLPIKVEFWRGKGEPYKGKNMSAKMREDVLYNNHMYVYATEPDTFGPKGATYDNHPLLAETGYQDANGNMMLVNDLFRAVHDYIAHTTATAGFGPAGEEAAWRNHMAATPNPWAKWGITSETRGQNSWVNFHHKKLEGMPLSVRPFADQKVDLLPIEFLQTGEPDIDADLADLPGSEGLIFEQEERGSIEFDAIAKSAKILLSGRADLSTFIHESGHMFVLMLLMWEADGVATPRQIAMLDGIYDYVGAKRGEPLTVEQHELLARAFENYVREGRAPSNILRQALDVMRKWMHLVYQTAKQLQAPLTPEITEVFDRMLASDEEIANAQQRFDIAPAFATAAEAGMTDEEFGEYQQKFEDSQNKARNNLDNKILAQHRKAQQREQRAARADLTAEVAAEVALRPIYAVQTFLRTGELPSEELPPEFAGQKLATDAVNSMIDKKDKRRLAFLKRKDGLHPDTVAEAFGFTNGKDMLEDIINAKPRAETIKAEVDQRMAAMFGDMLIDGSMPEEAATAMHISEANTFLTDELAALSKKAGRAGGLVPDQALRAAAERIVGGKSIASLRPDQHRHAATRARKATERAIAKGDWVEAYAQKQQQILQTHLAAAAAKTRTEADKIYGYLRRFERTRVRKRIGLVDEDYLNAIDDLLDGIELRRVPIARLERRKTLEEFIAERLADNEPVQIPPSVLDELGRTNYLELSLDRLEGIRDAVKNINHLAVERERIEVAGEKLMIRELLDEVQNTATANLRGRRRAKMHNPEGFDKAADGFHDWNAKSVKIEFIIKWLDGKAGGRLHKAIFEPIAKAQREAHRMRRVIFETIIHPLTRLPAAQQKRWHTQVTFGGEQMRMKDLIVVALNAGNEGNLKKLLAGHKNWGMTSREQLIAALDEHMLPEDWAVVQGIWDGIESNMRDPLFDVWQQQTGLRPTAVEAVTVESEHGTFRGGYYPIFYDPKRGRRAANREADKNAIGYFENNYLAPGNRTGAGNERVEIKNPQAILLDIDALGRELAEQIHFITHAGAIQQVHKVISTNQFRSIVEDSLGLEYYDLFSKWLQDIGKDGTVHDPTDLSKQMAWLRRGTAVAYMAFNVKTVLMQQMGLGVTAGELGATHFLHGIRRTLLSPNSWDNMKWAWENSNELEQTFETVDRDLRHIQRKIQTEGLTSTLGKGIDAVQKHGFSLIGASQLIVNMITFQGAFSKATSEGQTTEDAIIYADAIIRQTQSAGGMKDLAQVQRGGEFQKSVTSFYSFFSVFRNLIEGEIRNPSMKSLQLAIGAWIIPAAIEGLLDAEDEEEIPDEIIKEILFYPFTALPFLRLIINEHVADFGFNLTPGGGLLSRVVKDVDNIVQKLVDDEELTTYNRQNLADIITLLTRLPTGTVHKQYNKFLSEEEL